MPDEGDRNVAKKVMSKHRQGPENTSDHKGFKYIKREEFVFLSTKMVSRVFFWAASPEILKYWKSPFSFRNSCFFNLLSSQSNRSHIHFIYLSKSIYPYSEELQKRVIQGSKHIFITHWEKRNKILAREIQIETYHQTITASRCRSSLMLRTMIQTNMNPLSHYKLEKWTRNEQSGCCQPEDNSSGEAK